MGNIVLSRQVTPPACFQAGPTLMLYAPAMVSAQPNTSAIDWTTGAQILQRRSLPVASIYDSHWQTLANQTLWESPLVAENYGLTISPPVMTPQPQQSRTDHVHGNSDHRQTISRQGTSAAEEPAAPQPQDAASILQDSTLLATPTTTPQPIEQTDLVRVTHTSNEPAAARPQDVDSILGDSTVDSNQEGTPSPIRSFLRLSFIYLIVFYCVITPIILVYPFLHFFLRGRFLMRFRRQPFGG
ncbi:hypothetical protein MMC28_002036 [Mycoblastus sanguinarius]|nr:hypothetical protein [Mycoblastus sanguinarius]